jgi:hypothetical protein
LDYSTLLWIYLTNYTLDLKNIQLVEINPTKKNRKIKPNCRYAAQLQRNCTNKATVGPSVTLYEIVPEAGIRISKIRV